MKRIGSKDESSSQGGARTIRRELILYVEDDDANWSVAELRLSQGYQLLRAANAQEALQVLRSRGAELAGILMDIELRGSELDGVDLTRVIRGKHAERPLPAYARDLPPLLHTPIIFVTAHGAKYSDAELTFAGGDKVIPKPVDFGSLSIALTQLHLTRAARLKRKP